MTVYSLDPAYAVVAYHSDKGAHTETVPTRAWNAVPLVPGNVLGSYTNWLGLPCDGEEMFDELVDKLKVFKKTTSAIDSVTIYTKDSPTAPSIPRASKAYGVAGTNAATTWYQASESVWMMRDSAYNVFKIVLLDDPLPAGGFTPLTTLSGSADAEALVGVFTSDSWAFQSRANLKPTTFQKITYNLNKKLREDYNLN